MAPRPSRSAILGERAASVLKQLGAREIDWSAPIVARPLSLLSQRVLAPLILAALALAGDPLAIDGVFVSTRLDAPLPLPAESLNATLSDLRLDGLHTLTNFSASAAGPEHVHVRAHWTEIAASLRVELPRALAWAVSSNFSEVDVHMRWRVNIRPDELQLVADSAAARRRALALESVRVRVGSPRIRLREMDAADGGVHGAHRLAVAAIRAASRLIRPALEAIIARAVEEQLEAAIAEHVRAALGDDAEDAPPPDVRHVGAPESEDTEDGQCES